MVFATHFRSYLTSARCGSLVLFFLESAALGSQLRLHSRSRHVSVCGTHAPVSQEYVGSISDSKKRLLKLPLVMPEGATAFCVALLKGKYSLSFISAVARKAINCLIFSYSHCSEMGSNGGKHFIKVCII